MGRERRRVVALAGLVGLGRGGGGAVLDALPPQNRWRSEGGDAAPTPVVVRHTPLSPGNTIANIAGRTSPPSSLQ
ncbi:hypothetical protein E2C01_054291 [Portunus trituberculatus]|uniref:Uncharacterized protein n=1 Tax=Portunus trituberculatus TaxID=210409 RepID=A0A5B7GN27_PORTR|nr:hypothetical protein [Portunus trituberculatus]